MKQIGIVGAGIAGLHLGLMLQMHEIAATIYTEHTPSQLRAARIANMVIRSAPTRGREQVLAVDHWDTPATAISRISYYLRGMHELTIHGDLDEPLSAVDMRAYCARLLEDFVVRGGKVIYGALQPADVDALAARHDLVVVAAGRAKLATLFERRPEHSGFAQPQRIVCAGLFHGVAPAEPRALELVMVPQHGEIIVMPMLGAASGATGIGVEIIPGGPFEVLRQHRFADDPQRATATLLDLLREHAPMIAERIAPERFAATGPLDHGYAAITPTVRRAYRAAQNGRYILAIGDAHVVNDPLTGQGANTASRSAWSLGGMIRTADTFDLAFCERAEAELWAYSSAVTAACHARLRPPQPHVVQLMRAAAAHKPLANVVANGFNAPDQYWTLTSSAERTTAMIDGTVPPLVAAQ